MVYKVIENSDLTHEKNQKQNDNIFGRYVYFEPHNTKSLHKSRHSHMSPAEFGLRNQYCIKKSILYLCQNIIFLGMEIDSIKITLSFTPDKVQKVIKTSQNFLRSHSSTILEMTRVKDLLSLTIQTIDPVKIHIGLL